MRKLFEARPQDIYERATEILKDRPQSKQLEQLYIAVNLADVIATKPADMLIGDMPNIETGYDDESDEQRELNEIIERNNLQQVIHESTIGAGYRGDSWLKVRYDYREDYSEVIEMFGEDALPEDAKLEPIIEHVDATRVFPELADGENKRFKAVNITRVDYVENELHDQRNRNSEEFYFFLEVERHVPGAIMYETYQLHPKTVNTEYGEPIDIYTVGELIEESSVLTNIPTIPVYHVPYKSVDNTWEGIGGLEKVERIFYAINDRLTQIDYILWKHSDPNAYGPPIAEDNEITARFGGVYYEIEEGDQVPGYMTWDAQLSSAFRELDMLISLVFLNAETPQWVFGTVLTGDNKGGTGTSHTDGTAIKARFMPILSKVARIRTRYDVVIKNILETCLMFRSIDNDNRYTGEVVRPTINWKDGLPKNKKEEAEIANIRLGGAPTLDQHTAIKRLDELDDIGATEILRRIEEDDERVNGIDDLDFFNRLEVLDGEEDSEKEKNEEEEEDGKAGVLNE